MYFFLSHPIQYYTPIFQAISKETSLEVFYYSDVSIKGAYDEGFGKVIKWNIPLLDGYKFNFLFDWVKGKSLNNRLFDVFNPSVFKLLMKSPEKIIVLNGWSYSTDILIIFLGKLFRKKIWIRGDNSFHLENQKDRKTILLKKLLLSPFFYLFIDKFLFVGKQNELFYKYYGVKESKLVYVPHVVDNDYFKKQYLFYKNDKQNLKKSLGLPTNKKVILFVGKYITEKQPLDLLQSFELLPKGKYTLVFVGEGKLRIQMETFIFENKLEDVFLTGFINQKDIVKYYTVADLFVLTSKSETWGLSVNEAMNFELPIIVSSSCGCSEDLVLDGCNGFVYNAGDISTLSQQMETILSNDLIRQNMGEFSLSHIEKFSINKFVQNLMSLV